MKLERAIFASGCFWGAQSLFDQLVGVVKTSAGYCGGSAKNPSYEQVLTGRTGYSECVEVTFDPKKISYEELTKYFFEIHDSTQVDGQGPDIGNQYRSAIFYINKDQRKTALRVIGLLKEKDLIPVTEIKKATKFWPAEDYHQKYYEKFGGVPYCHVRKPIF